MVVVYKAHPGPELKAVLTMLRKARLNPVVLDNMDPVLIQKSYGLSTVRVAVPPDQANQARQALQNHEAQAAPVVRSQSRLFVMQLLISLVVGVIVSGVMGCMGFKFEQLMGYGFGVTVVTLIAISNLYQPRDK